MILPTHAPRVRRRLGTELDRAGIHRHLGQPVTRVESGVAVLEGGRRIAADAVVWATGSAAAPWLADTGLGLDEHGFVAVDGTLRSITHPVVFAAGDCASIIGQPRPRSGVFAVRQGPTLASNLRSAARGRGLRRYRPQRRFLSLISTGDRRAVASRAGLAATGAGVWHLKDWIDRRFMRRYRPRAAMERAADPVDSVPGFPAALAALAMRCAGCGAKLPGGPLDRALSRLPATAVDLARRDDAAQLSPPQGRLILQSLDWFPAPLDDPYTAGRIAAVHALGDIHAMGGVPWTALALATVPPDPDTKVEETLFQLLSGACRELEAAGARLVGGHSAEAPSMGLGLAVNGLAEPDRVLRKGGARPGDVLILTKPVGTGLILAAAMRGRARGAWYGAALAAMLRGTGTAARQLRDHGASAMTDVTGFGLGGHLLEMLAASHIDAEIDAAAIPLLPGAARIISAGITSSLGPSNADTLRQAVAGQVDPATLVMLADPQTAGGLLAALPEDRAADCVAALRAAGDDDAAIIGRVTRASDDRPRLAVRHTAV